MPLEMAIFSPFSQPAIHTGEFGLVGERAERPCRDWPFTLSLEGSLISRGGVARAGSIFRRSLDSSAKSYSYPGDRFLPG